MPIQTTANLLDIQQSPDGRRLLAHDWINPPKLWDAERMLLLAELEPPIGREGNTVSSARMSPDGKLIATASMGRVVVWDAASARMIGVRAEEVSQATTIIWSRDSKWLLSCTRDGKVGVSPAKDPAKVSWLGRHSMIVRQADISNDGSLVVMSSRDGTATLWKVTGELIASLGRQEPLGESDPDLPKNDLKAVSFSSDDSQILVSSTDGFARVYDAKSGKEVFKHSHVIGYRGILTNVQMGARFCGPKGEWILFAEEDGTMKLVDRKTFQPVRELTGHTKSLREIRVSLDGQKAGTYGNDLKLKVWDVAAGKELPFSLPEDDDPMAGEFSFDSRSFWVGYRSGTIRRHELASGIVQQIQSGAAMVLRNVRFFGASKRLRLLVSPNLASDEERPVYVSMTESQPSFSLEERTHSHVASEDGRWVVCQLPQGRGLQVRDLDRPGQERPVRDWSYRQAIFDAKGENLYITQSAGVFKISLASMEITDSWGFGAKPQPWQDALLSPDGSQMILSDYRDEANKRKVIVLNLAESTFTVLSQFKEGYTKSSWTPDGSRILVADHEQVEVFDGKDHKLQKTIPLGKFEPVRTSLTAVNSQYLVIGGFFSLLVDLDAGKVARELGPTSDLAEAGAAISDDGKLIAFLRRGRDLKTPEPDSLRVEELVSGRQVAVWRDSKITGCGFIKGVSNRLWVDHFNDLDVLSLDLAKGAIKREGTFAAMMDGSWLALDDEGRYDAPDPSQVPGASYVISWPGGIEAIEVEQMKGRYYDPNLFPKMLGLDKDPRRTVPLLSSLRLFPEVKVSQNSRKPSLVDIELKARDEGGIGKIQVKVNGKIVDSKEGKGYFSIDRAVFANLMLPEAALPPGASNWLEVTASNEDGDLTSPPVRFDLGVPTDLKAPKVKLYALFTGAGDYIGQTGDLDAPPKDARELSKSLQITAERLLPSSVEVQVMTTGDPDPAKKPTRANILAWLKETSAKATSSDILLIYLSGHGASKIGDKTGYFYLCADADPSALTPAAIGVTTVSGEDLQAALAAIPAQKQVVILDTCHSGAAAKDLVAERSVSGDYRRAYESLRDASGVWLLAGSAADQLSYESSQVDHGMLTYSLLEAIDQASPAGLRPGNSGELFLDVERWLNYAADRVESLKNEVGIKGVQRPEFRRSSSTSFDIGLTKPEFRGRLGLRPPKPVVVLGAFDMDEEDPIGLEPVIAKEMRQAEGVKAWFEVAKHPFVYRMAGSYTLTNEIVKVRLVIQRFDGEMNRKTLETIELEGAKSNLQALAQKIRLAVEQKITALETGPKTQGGNGGTAAQPAKPR